MKEPKRTLLFESNLNDNDKICAFQIGGVLSFYFNDELCYKIPLPVIFFKKGRKRIEQNLTTLLLERGVDIAVIENLLNGVIDDYVE